MRYRVTNEYAGMWNLCINGVDDGSVDYYFDEKPRMETGGDAPYIHYSGKTEGRYLDVYIVRANVSNWYVEKVAETGE